MVLPIPVPMPVAQGIIYGITRAIGEVWSRIAGTNVSVKAEADLRQREFWLQQRRLDLDVRRLDLEGVHLAAEHQRHLDQISFERERLREHLALEREKMHAHAVQRVQEIQLSAELKQIYEHHPIRLTPRTFQRDYAKDRIPLHIVLVPPKGPGGVDEMRNLVPEIEDDLLSFVQEHYHAATSSHPAKLLTETWIPGRPCGSSAVQGLFGLLEGIPMLIVEAVALSEGLGFRIGFWGLEQGDSSYARIGTVPWTALAVDPTAVPTDPAIRDAALRAETLVAAGRLLPWYKLIVSVTADQFHLLQSGAKPLLPKLLPAILGKSDASSTAFEQVIEGTLEAYRQIYAAFAAAHGALAPDLMLDLAEALVDAGRPIEADKVASDALTAFAAVRGAADTDNLLVDAERLASGEDVPLLERLANIHAHLSSASTAAHLRLVAAKFADRQPSEKKSSLTAGMAFRDVDETWCPEMVVIPSGAFLMGTSRTEITLIVQHSTDKDHVQEELRPTQRRAHIRESFAIGRYTVTQSQFNHFLNDVGFDYRDPLGGDDSLPATGVSWNEAQSYCEWLSDQTRAVYRLPSEDEWEYACRAGTITPFSFGSMASEELANYNYRGWNSIHGKTMPVDAFAPNPFGLYQMHGNVWEWCNEKYVARGGSCVEELYNIRSGARYATNDERRTPSYAGFRIARSL